MLLLIQRFWLLPLLQTLLIFVEKTSATYPESQPSPPEFWSRSRLMNVLWNENILKCKHILSTETAAQRDTDWSSALRHNWKDTVESHVWHSHIFIVLINTKQLKIINGWERWQNKILRLQITMTGMWNICFLFSKTRRKSVCGFDYLQHICQIRGPWHKSGPPPHIIRPWERSEIIMNL